MRLRSSRVIIVQLDPFSQHIVINLGNCSSSDPSISVDSFTLDEYFFQTRGIFSIGFLRTES